MRSCSCDFCPRMSLVSAVILGGQTHEPSHQIRDHLRPILARGYNLLCFAEEVPLEYVSLSITWVSLPAQPSEQLGACWAVAAFGLVLLRTLVFRRRDLRVLDQAPSEGARQPRSHNRARQTGCSRHGGSAGLRRIAMCTWRVVGPGC